MKRKPDPHRIVNKSRGLEIISVIAVAMIALSLIALTLLSGH